MITELTENSIAVQIPSDAEDVRCYSIGGEYRIAFTSRIQDPLKVGGDIIPLAAGNWRILGRPAELTEEQWKAIIPRIDGDLAWIPSYNDPDSGGHGFCYDDYESEDEHTVYYTATESGLSLLKSKNVSIDNVIILVKK